MLYNPSKKKKKNLNKLFIISTGDFPTRDVNHNAKSYLLDQYLCMCLMFIISWSVQACNNSDTRHFHVLVII